MTIEEARALIASPIWGKVRDSFLATGSFNVYPVGDIRRLDYLDKGVRNQIALWQEGLVKADSWKKILSGDKVRELKASYPGVYPEVFRYTTYFAKYMDKFADGVFPEEATRLLLKLKFPDAYDLCFK